MNRSMIAVALSLAAGLTVGWGIDAFQPEALGKEDLPELPYEKIRDALPRMGELAKQGGENGVHLHALADKLTEDNTPEREKELRLELRDRLQRHIEIKQQVVAVTKGVLGLEKPLVNGRPVDRVMTEEQIREKLANTMLNDIFWKKDSFKKCLRDLERALKIPIRMQYHVVQRNTVDYKFRSLPAETVLGTLCSGFDLRYLVFEGEIIVYKKITPNEERFLDYQRKHPDVKLKYWERENADGSYDEEEK